VPQPFRIVAVLHQVIFGGLSEHETAEVLAVSRATVTREWNVARAWLFRRLTLGITEVPRE
jgi:hypothetical protein